MSETDQQIFNDAVRSATELAEKNKILLAENQKLTERIEKSITVYKDQQAEIKLLQGSVIDLQTSDGDFKRKYDILKSTVIQMRGAQKSYFASSRNNVLMQQAKALEKKVDELVDTIHYNQKELFK